MQYKKKKWTVTKQKIAADGNKWSEKQKQNISAIITICCVTENEMTQRQELYTQLDLRHRATDTCITQQAVWNKWHALH